MLSVAAVIQLMLVLADTLVSASGQGTVLDAAGQWRLHLFYSVLNLTLVVASVLVCALIVRRFRHLRVKEVQVVYHAHYLSEGGYQKAERHS